MTMTMTMAMTMTMTMTMVMTKTMTMTMTMTEEILYTQTDNIHTYNTYRRCTVHPPPLPTRHAHNTYLHMLTDYFVAGTLTFSILTL